MPPRVTLSCTKCMHALDASSTAITLRERPFGHVCWQRGLDTERDAMRISVYVLRPYGLHVSKTFGVS